MNGRKLLVMLVAILGLLVGVAPVYATPTAQGISAGGTVEVHNTEGLGLKVRSQPSIADDNILGKVFDDTRLVVQEGPQDADGYSWWKLRLEGWAAADWLSPAPSVGVTVQVQGTGEAGLRVRTTPNIADDNILGKVFDETRFQVLEGPQSASGYQWWKVRLDGWAAVNWLRLVEVTTDPQVECLARAVMSEASVGTREEQVAVAWTIFNRQSSGEHGATVCEVVEAPGQYAYGQEPSASVLQLASELMVTPGTDPTGGATHFFSPISMPKEGEPTAGYDVGAGLHEVPGIEGRVYFPSWTTTMEWVGELLNVRRAYFMFYREATEQPAMPTTTPVMVTPTPTATPVPATPTATATPVPSTPTPTTTRTPGPPTPTQAATPLPPTSTPTPMSTPVPPGGAVFRVGPVVSLRPLNDEVTRAKDGLVEVFFSNPALNDVAMIVEMFVSVPSGLHVYGEGFGTAAAAGTVQGLFEAPPGAARTISMNIKSEKVGEFFVHFSGLYYPKGNKDMFNPISLTHPFTVRETSRDPLNPEPAGAELELVPTPTPTSAPSGGFSCNFSPASASTNGVGDLAMVLVPILGLVVWKRRPWR